jgi:Fe-S cluster assembly protein SufD
VNGRYAPELSDTSGIPEEVAIIRLRDALNTYGNFLQGRLSRWLKEETDPFVLLNMAMIQMGLFLYVPPKVVVERPLQCLHVISNEKPVIFNPRVHFFLGAHSKLTWLYDQHCMMDFESFSNAVVDVALEEGACFEQYGLLNPCKHGWYLEATRAILKRDSQFKSLTCNAGSKSVREDYRITLMGENASCDLKGISVLCENRQAHVNVFIDHQAPHCRSNQLFKNILNDTSRCSFEGKIYVHPKAQKTEAYQLNNNLILTDKALANSKPNL